MSIPLVTLLGRMTLAFLEAIGSVEEHRDSKIAVTVGSQTRFFDIPSHKDIDTDAVVDLRHMLSAAGYEPEAEED